MTVFTALDVTDYSIFLKSGQYVPKKQRKNVFLYNRHTDGRKKHPQTAARNRCKLTIEIKDLIGYNVKCADM